MQAVFSYCRPVQLDWLSSILDSHSMIHVLCAGRVLADRTQPLTPQGYQEWTSLLPPHPLPPQAHLAMRTPLATHRSSPSPPPHIWKPHNIRQMRPKGSSLQLRPGQLSVSIQGDESRWTLNLLQTVSHHSSPCAERTLGPAPAAIVAEYLRRWDWAVLKEDPERLWIIIIIIIKVGLWPELEQSLSQSGLLFDGDMSLPRGWDTFYI